MSVGQLPTATDATADDAMLARLDFANDSLTLNLGALIRFGNPFLVDVAASALLSVAVAESIRGRRNKRGSNDTFAPPPPSSVLGKKEPSTARAFGESFAEGFEKFGGKPKMPAASLRKWSMKSSATARSSSSKSGSFDKDIELGEWYGQKSNVKVGKMEMKQKKEQRDDDEKMGFGARTVIGVLTFAFKAIIFILRIAIKVVAGLIVMITKNFSKL